MQKAFKDKDYAAWQKLMAGRGRKTQVINEKNFGKFAQAHQLMLEGKKDEAAKIRAELGLGLQNGAGKGTGTGFGRSAK
jgi:CRISPR/Cas system endoribonuclease Cas6 (RAMP superfamily)